MASTAGHLPSRERLCAVLRANGIFSLSTGVIGVLFGGWFADLFGIDELGWLVRVISVVLIAFGLFGLWVARGDDRTLGLGAMVISVCDIAWVVATVVLVIAGTFSFAGGTILALAAMAVANFGGGQLWLRSHWLR